MCRVTFLTLCLALKKDLESGKKVLFSGTPCQVDSLNGYLKKEYDNLYTVDIICHGVPSQKLLNDYIHTLSDSVETFEFRDKKKRLERLLY